MAAAYVFLLTRWQQLMCFCSLVSPDTGYIYTTLSVHGYKCGYTPVNMNSQQKGGGAEDIHQETHMGLIDHPGDSDMIVLRHHQAFWHFSSIKMFRNTHIRVVILGGVSDNDTTGEVGVLTAIFYQKSPGPPPVLEIHTDKCISLSFIHPTCKRQYIFRPY